MTRRVEVRHPRWPAREEDGVRVLVDRRWPPGLRREELDADLWLREIAPSDALLRRGTGRWEGQLGRLYRRELQGRIDLLRMLARLHTESHLTLLSCSAVDADAPLRILSDVIEELAGGALVA